MCDQDDSVYEQMLVIRKEQIQHFIAADEHQLVEVIERSIRLANGERVAGYDETELTSMVRIGIGRARSRGLTGAEDIAAFVAVMFEIAPRFDEQAQIREVFDDIKFTPEIRFYQLFDRVPEEAWIEAQENYEEAYWFTAATDTKE